MGGVGGILREPKSMLILIEPPVQLRLAYRRQQR
jgi:hypothetical protein